jgi:putative flippase GtrA
VLAFLTAMVVSFFLHCSVTFRTRPTLRKFLLFPLSNATGFGLQTVALSVLVDVVGMNPAYAPLHAMAAAVPVTFLVARLVLLDHRRTRQHRGVTTLAGTGA